MASLDIIAFVVYLSVTLSLAYLGYGVYALVWGTLVRTGVKSVLLLITGLKSHIPTLYFNLKEVKYFLNFGSFRTGSFLVSFLNKQLDSILIGKFIGVGELGIYDVFKRIVQQPIRLLSPVIQKVTYPLMAKVNEDKKRVTNMFIKVLELLNLIRFPIFVGIALIAPEITNLFLGSEWSEHVLVLQVLSFVFLFSTIQSFVGISILSSGKSNWNFYNNIALLPLNIVVILVGANYGILGISLGLLFKSLLIIYPRYKFILSRIYDLSFIRYFKIVFLKLLPFVIFISLAHFIFQQFQFDDVFSLTIKTILFLLFISVLLFFTEKKSMNYLKSLISNK
jgi:O-antigen/teichoic acid export membrane protein